MNMTSHAVTTVQTEDAVLQLEYDLADILRDRQGMHEREAYEMARDLVEGMRKRYGGVQLGRRGLYIPAPSKAERDERIRREFNGTNAVEVCKEHGIKRSRLYQIVGRSTGKPVGQSSAACPVMSNSPVSSLNTGLTCR